jgi:hypothetical protein
MGAGMGVQKAELLHSIGVVVNIGWVYAQVLSQGLTAGAVVEVTHLGGFSETTPVDYRQTQIDDPVSFHFI